MMGYGFSPANDSTMTFYGNGSATGTTMTWFNYSYPDNFNDAAFEAYQKWLRSRNWVEAPKVIKPVISIMGKRIICHRFTNNEWTGKNFRKVHV